MSLEVIIFKVPHIGFSNILTLINYIYIHIVHYFFIIYLWRKVVCLFCLYPWDPLNQDALDRVLSLFGKLLRRRGASAWFHGIWTWGVKVLKYWMISSLKIKLNHSWNFRRNWNVPLVLLKRSWWAGFNRIYLVRFGFRMLEILTFKWFLPLKVQINSKNQVLEGKISWNRGDTWANSAGHTSCNYSIKISWDFHLRVEL
jgi:hypothetical protein